MRLPGGCQATAFCCRRFARGAQLQAPRRTAVAAEDSVAAAVRVPRLALGKTKASARVIVVCSAAGQTTVTMVFGA